MAVGWSPGRDEAAALRDEFDRLNCRHHFLVAKPARREPMPKACEAILYSISFYAFEGKESVTLVACILFVSDGSLKACVHAKKKNISYL